MKKVCRTSSCTLLVGLLLAMVIASPAIAREALLPWQAPQNFVLLGGYADLRDDIYSGDFNLMGEYAPCNCFSVYGSISYRLLSYEWDAKLHNEIHEAVNLQVNGFNESYIGVKFVPYSFFGVDVNWRNLPGGGDSESRFYRLGVEPFGLYRFSRNLNLGAGAQYYTFLEHKNYQPGDELGLKASLTWRVFWNEELRKGWQLDYAFLYRWRLQESKNLNLEKPYQKMDDLYRGFRLRLDAGRFFPVAGHSLGVELFYEMSRGSLFGAETGHTVGLYTKYIFG